ncbi:MAG: exonuclease [Nostocaceae cyanobacterium]|nr:exonuclease [Nostocaceae cyanobacterium]
MKTTYINGHCYYIDNNGVLLPAVTTVLKATQPQKSVAVLSNWRNTKGNAQANKIISNSIRRGKALHKLIKKYLQGDLPKPDNNWLEPYWYSIQPVLNQLSDIKLIEQLVPNDIEAYAGKVDLVARYKGIPHIIEWTTAEKPKLEESKLYDKPLQLVAYSGAVNRGKIAFGRKISRALIVVALPGEKAEIFEFDRPKLINYWKQWLSRLKCFYGSIAA